MRPKSLAYAFYTDLSFLVFICFRILNVLGGILTRVEYLSARIFAWVRLGWGLCWMIGIVSSCPLGVTFIRN